jgi:hypothetical protein
MCHLFPALQVFVTDEELATWPEEDQTAYLDSCDALIDARLAELKNPDLYPITDNGVIIIDIGSSVFRMGYMYCTEEYPIRVPNVLALLPVCVLARSGNLVLRVLLSTAEGGFLLGLDEWMNDYFHIARASQMANG